MDKGSTAQMASGTPKCSAADGESAEGSAESAGEELSIDEAWRICCWGGGGGGVRKWGKD